MVWVELHSQPAWGSIKNHERAISNQDPITIGGFKQPNPTDIPRAPRSGDQGDYTTGSHRTPTIEKSHSSAVKNTETNTKRQPHWEGIRSRLDEAKNQIIDLEDKIETKITPTKQIKDKVVTKQERNFGTTWKVTTPIAYMYQKKKASME